MTVIEDGNILPLYLLADQGIFGFGKIGFFYFIGFRGTGRDRYFFDAFFQCS